MAASPNAVRGALWMGGAVLSFCAMAVAVRELQRSMGSFEILFVRSVVMLAIVAALLPRTPGAWRTRQLGLHVWRNLIHLAGQYLWVASIGLLTLATVFAIEFTIAVWVAVLATLFLHERLTSPRLVQLALGVAGILIILRPGTMSFDPAALLMLLGSMCYAASIVLTKRISAQDSAPTVLFWMSLLQMPVTLVAALPQWVTPPAASLPWAALIGAASYCAHYCMTRSLMQADATVVAPIDFIRLPLIAVLGALLYGEAFDPLVIAGAVIIFAGTYYSIRRDTSRGGENA